MVGNARCDLNLIRRTLSKDPHSRMHIAAAGHGQHLEVLAADRDVRCVRRPPNWGTLMRYHRRLRPTRSQRPELDNNDPPAQIKNLRPWRWVCSAHAGMSRGLTTLEWLLIGPLRARGDEPLFIWLGPSTTQTAPHTRG